MDNQEIISDLHSHLNRLIRSSEVARKNLCLRLCRPPKHCPDCLFLSKEISIAEEALERVYDHLGYIAYA